MAHRYSGSHQEHEFGVADVDVNLPFEGLGDRQTAQIPAPEINNLYRQQLTEEQQEATRQAINEEAAEEIAVRTQWKRDFNFGAVVRPHQPTLRGYKFVLRENNGANNLQFSRQQYPIFDNVIVHECGVDHTNKSVHPAFNSSHPYYKDFAPLRRNIAILRNYLLATMFADGEYIPKDKSPAGIEDFKNHEKIQQMAVRLGKALSGGITKPGIVGRFFRSVGKLLTGADVASPDISDFMQAANMPDKGITVMYDYLLGVQNRPGFWDSLPFVHSSREWGLAEREKTPFSIANLHAYSRSSMLEGVVNKLDQVAANLKSVDTLTAEDKKVSVDHARTILEKLKILMGQTTGQGMDVNEIADAKQATSFVLLRATVAFEDSLAELSKYDPNLLQDPIIKDAIDAVDSINYAVKNETYRALIEEGETAGARLMAKRRAASSPKSKEYVPMEDLVARLESGLSRTSQLQKATPAKAAVVQMSKVNKMAQAVNYQQHQAHTDVPGRKLDAAKQAVKQTNGAATMTLAPNARVAQSSATAAAQVRALNAQMIQHQQEIARQKEEEAKARAAAAAATYKGKPKAAR